MHALPARAPLYTAGLTVILVTALAACGSNSGGGPAAATTPMAAVRLAAQTSDGATSFTGTMSLQATATAGATGSASGAGTGSTSLSASFAEQLHPALLDQINVRSLSAAGTSLPGGLTEIITPGDLYMKWSYLTTLLHTAKPWIVIPISSLSKTSGVSLSQIFNQASSSSPLTDSQLLGGATSVRKVGPRTVDGVAVTEYTGKLSLHKGIKYLSASSRAAIQKQLSTAGISTGTFTVWIDGKNIVRKAIISEDGTAVTETITTMITSIDQPVSVSVPVAGQTSALPSGNL